MTLTRLATAAVLVTFLLSITSCNRFGSRLNGPKPTQVVDLPSMIGKTPQEITKIIGTPPDTDDTRDVEWELPEGRLSLSKTDGKIGYTLKRSYTGFASSAEMAALVNVNVQSRKVREGRGLQSYDHISVDGKTFNLLILLESRGYYDAIISDFEIGGQVPKGFKPTQVVDLPQMIGKSPQDITKMVGTSPYKDEKTAADWVLPEGRLSVFKNTDFISYNLKSYSDFDPDRGVGSPEEIAALVKVDIQGRQSENIRDGVVAYRNLNVNGKTLDLYINVSDKRYTGAWIANFK